MSKFTAVEDGTTWNLSVDDGTTWMTDGTTWDGTTWDGTTWVTNADGTTWS